MKGRRCVQNDAPLGGYQQEHEIGQHSSISPDWWVLCTYSKPLDPTTAVLLLLRVNLLGCLVIDKVNLTLYGLILIVDHLFQMTSIYQIIYIMCADNLLYSVIHESPTEKNHLEKWWRLVLFVQPKIPQLDFLLDKPASHSLTSNANVQETGKWILSTSYPKKTAQQQYTVCSNLSSNNFTCYYPFS